MFLGLESEGRRKHSGMQVGKDKRSLAKHSVLCGYALEVAERMGFEPTRPFWSLLP
jgi:hypothetical protein